MGERQHNAEGQGFDALWFTESSIQCGVVAQMGERSHGMREVGGSMPPDSTTFAGVAQLVERNLAKVEVTGSSPVFRSNIWQQVMLQRICLCFGEVAVRLIYHRHSQYGHGHINRGNSGKGSRLIGFHLAQCVGRSMQTSLL